MDFQADAILFDLDGVLVNSRACVEATWRRWAATNQLDPSPFLAVAHGRRTSETLQAVAPQLDVSRATADLDRLEACTTEGVLPVPGAGALLARVPAARWAIVTSGSRDVAQLRLRHTGLPIPAVLVTGQDVTRGKPEPDGYLLAASRLAIAPSACVVIEDAPAGLAAGRAAGMQLIAVASTHDPETLSAADCVVGALAAVQITDAGPARTLRIRAACRPPLAAV